jgi:hypothetical protein
MSCFKNRAGVAQSVVSDYRLGDRVSIHGRGNDFPVASVSRSSLRPTQLPISGYRQSISEGKARPGRDADHSPPSSAEVKNE